MNEELMWICSMHHLMPYAIHEMKRHPRNVCLLTNLNKKKKNTPRKNSLDMTTKAATVIA